MGGNTGIEGSGQGDQDGIAPSGCWERSDGTSFTSRRNGDEIRRDPDGLTWFSVIATTEPVEETEE